MYEGEYIICENPIWQPYASGYFPKKINIPKNPYINPMMNPYNSMMIPYNPMINPFNPMIYPQINPVMNPQINPMMTMMNPCKENQITRNQLKNP